MLAQGDAGVHELEARAELGDGAGG